MTADTPTGDAMTPQDVVQKPPAETPAKHLANLPTDAAHVGKVRETGVAILLYIVTLGFYGLYWSYAVHKEIREESKEGLGGPLGLVLAVFVFFVVGYTLPGEIRNLYTRRGMEPPVTPMTGLWVLPGSLIIVGPIIWFVKVNGALNAYWRSQATA